MTHVKAEIISQPDCGETNAFHAAEFPGSRRYDRIVAITRSGTGGPGVGSGAAAPRHLTRSAVLTRS
jgi:hypothetical protein